MARRLDPQQAASNWVTGLGQAGEKIRQGVQAVTEAPGVKAARNAQGYVNGVTQNVQKWQRKVAAVSLGDWVNATITKGVPRIAQGAQAAQGKYQDGVTPLFSFMGNLLNSIDGMPNDSPAARDARMLRFAQGMREYQGRG